MINRSTDNIKKQLKESKILLKDSKLNKDLRFAIYNYIGNLYASLYCLGDTETEYNRNEIFGNEENYNDFTYRIDSYEDVYIDNFLKNKDFHKDYLYSIITEVQKYLYKAYPLEEERIEYSEKDFIDIIYQFMKTIDREKVFDEIYKDGRIYSTIGQNNKNMGFALYNPASKETDFFIKDFKCDIESMIATIHELGHGEDLSRPFNDIKTYNNYFYLSTYGEVISRMYERLLLRYLIKNNISLNSAKNSLLEYELTNHDFILQSYIFSLLDKEFIKSGEYLDCSPKEITEKIKKHFLEDDSIEYFITGMQESDIAEVYNYAYGDIISMFLAESVEQDGFDNELINYFFTKRATMFDDRFLKKNGMDAKKYVKLHKAEMKLLKK